MYFIDKARIHAFLYIELEEKCFIEKYKSAHFIDESRRTVIYRWIIYYRRILYIKLKYKNIIGESRTGVVCI